MFTCATILTGSSCLVNFKIQIKGQIGSCVCVPGKTQFKLDYCLVGSYLVGNKICSDSVSI